MNTGYKIKEYREKKNISQTELAKISGVSRTIIVGLETGTYTTTTTDTLLKIAKALDVKVQDIFLNLKNQDLQDLQSYQNLKIMH